MNLLKGLIVKQGKKDVLIDFLYNIEKHWIHKEMLILDK